MNDPLRRRLLAYFDAAAAAYPTHIEPVFSALAAPWVQALDLPPGARVLDLGAGTGAASRLAKLAGAHPTALDFSLTMLRAGERVFPAVCGDMHALPFPAARFDAALAMLAFNSTDPTRAFREAFRVLRPGGRLHLQEWGTVDALAELLDDTLAAYATDDPPPALAAERAAQQAAHPWDALETSDDIAALLGEIGFRAVQVRIVTAEVPLTPGAFIAYKLAWPIRRAEIAALSDEARALLQADLEENVGALAEEEGMLRWQPNMVQVTATRP